MESVFFTFCAYLPIHLLAYLPFLDVLRFGKRWMAATVAGNVLLHMLGVAWVVSIGRPDLIMGVGYTMVPISLALYFLNIKLSPGKLLFTYVLLVNYQLIATGIASFLAARLFGASPRSWQCGLICMALFILAWRPVCHLFHSAADQIYRIQAPQLWRVIWLLPATMSGIVIVLTGALQDEMVKSWQFLVARTSLLLCVVLVYWVLLRSLESIRRQTVLQEQLNFETHLLEVQINEEKRYSQMVMEHTNQLRQQRHDLRHQLAVIQQLADSNPAELKTYISSLIDDIPPAPQIYCENLAVNAVVSHYAAMIRNQGIDLEICLTVPPHSEQVLDGELCVIFGNLLENALEACDRLKNGPGRICLNSKIQYSTLTITMDNSFDGTVKLENGRFLSSKRDDLGVGLISIQAVARKHQGDARFEAQGSLFRSSVYLQI